MAEARGGGGGLRPPRRVTVLTGAEAALALREAGGSAGILPWTPSASPKRRGGTAGAAFGAPLDGRRWRGC